MNTVNVATGPNTAYRLCFEAPAMRAGGFDFPCDASGRVDLDRLSERSRNDYFYARVVAFQARVRPMLREQGAGRAFAQRAH